MSKRDDGGPAFPRPMSEDKSGGDQPDGNRNVDEQDGMKLRDWFAGQALAGEMATWANAGPPEDYADKIAGRCYSIARAMLAERSKPAPESPQETPV